MIQHFNNEGKIIRYIQLWYMFSNGVIFKKILKKIFRISIYNLHTFYTLEELNDLFQNFNENQVEKYSSNLCNFTDNEELMVIIEEEFEL